MLQIPFLFKGRQNYTQSNAHIGGQHPTFARQIAAATLPGSRSEKLRPPPSPLYLFINYACYRKWALSKLILGFSFILPPRFKNRMCRRMTKRQGEAAKLAQRRDAVIAQLTVPAQKIFLELEALYTRPPEMPNREG